MTDCTFLLVFNYLPQKQKRLTQTKMKNYDLHRSKFSSILLALIKLFQFLKQMTAEPCLLSLILSEMQQINFRLIGRKHH